MKKHTAITRTKSTMILFTVFMLAVVTAIICVFASTANTLDVEPADFDLIDTSSVALPSDDSDVTAEPTVIDEETNSVADDNAPAPNDEAVVNEDADSEVFYCVGELNEDDMARIKWITTDEAIALSFADAAARRIQVFETSVIGRTDTLVTLLCHDGEQSFAVPIEELPDCVLQQDVLVYAVIYNGIAA